MSPSLRSKPARHLGLFTAFIALCACSQANAQDIRVATYHTELSRKGPGLLLHDILSGTDPQITAVLDVLIVIRPDILAIQGFDHDTETTRFRPFKPR